MIGSKLVRCLCISVKVGGANVSSDYNKAVEEMMDKIKRGAVLRPVLKPVKKVQVCFYESQVFGKPFFG